MKKATRKRLPLHRETLVKLQEPQILRVQGGSDGPTSHAIGCPNYPHSGYLTC